MNNRPTQRGQAVQVGAVVVLGFVVLAMAIFQSQGVPQETVETELEHNQEIAGQLETLGVALAETTATGNPRAVELTLGTTYDGRLFFVYPPPTAGSLETTAPRTITIENATTTEESSEFGNYWNLTADETRNYSTRSIQYSIEYRELRETPDYVFEYGIAAAEFENSTQDRSPSLDDDIDEPVIDDTNISLVVYDGELTERSVTTETIVTERVTNSTTVELEANESTGPITLNLSTELPEDAWNDEWDYDDDTGTVSRSLSDTSYNLTVHKVDVGPNPTQPQPTYLRELDQNNNQNITVDVRTAYNDRVAETVSAWVFNESQLNESDPEPEETVRIPPEEFTYETDFDEPDEPACLAISEPVENAAAYELLDIKNSSGMGACP